jgi:hypothetical protein
MDFIVKDLMISVLPLRSGLGDITACGACTGITTFPGLGASCGVSGTKIPRESWLDYVINPATPAALAALKQQLREALAAVEAREKVVHQSMRPTSAAEISILQSHLTAALEELRESAAALQSYESEGSPEQS